GSNAGSYAVVGSGLTANNGNYTFAQAAGNATAFKITKTSLTITAKDAARAVGAVNPAFSIASSGFVLGQDPSVLGGTLNFMTTTNTSSPAGTYPGAIIPSGLTSSNYNITFVNGTLTILSVNKVLSASDESSLRSAVAQANSDAASGISDTI